jgi:hypothetical protein
MFLFMKASLWPDEIRRTNDPLLHPFDHPNWLSLTTRSKHRTSRLRQARLRKTTFFSDCSRVKRSWETVSLDLCLVSLLAV